MMKEYKNDKITVYWFPELCAHPGTCLKMLPEVFNINRRPWIDVNAATPEEIIKCIDECPSGALRYSLPENTELNPNIVFGIGNIDYEKTNPPKVKIKITGSGPILIEGPAEIISSDGTQLKSGSRMVLCGCGKSGNNPFCDGSHISKKCK